MSALEPTFPDSMSRDSSLVRIDAAAVFDATLAAAPGSILLERTPGQRWPARVLAVGPTPQVQRHPLPPGAPLRVISRPGDILIPGTVNAHTHLDLTHIGPQPHDPAGGFVPWIDMVRARRAQTPSDIAASVQRGIELSLRAGVVAVGDIAGAPQGRLELTPWRTLAKSPLSGTSFLEFFGMGTTVESRGDALEILLRGLASTGFSSGGVQLGLQPHAPNTVSPRLYARAVRLAREFGLPLSTHLAESPDESRFIAHGGGPQQELLERVGVWDESILSELGKGLHPVAHLKQVLQSAHFVAAHVNDCPDEAVELLAATRTSVVYCPRASAYFGAERHFGPHRYRDLFGAGVNVALGTDSIVNLPPDSAGMGVLDEARYLYKRDRTDPRKLLAMMTTNAAEAIGLPSVPFRFMPGDALAGLVAVGVPNIPAGRIGESLFASDGPPLVLLNKNGYDFTG